MNESGRYKTRILKGSKIHSSTFADLMLVYWRWQTSASSQNHLTKHYMGTEYDISSQLRCEIKLLFKQREALMLHTTTLFYTCITAIKSSTIIVNMAVAFDNWPDKTWCFLFPTGRCANTARSQWPTQIAGQTWCSLLNQQ